MKKKTYLLGIILDCTLSFSKVYPQIYYMLERMIGNLQKEDCVRFGITLMGDEVNTVIFSNGSHFTEDGEEVLQELSHISFSGGSRNGKEELTQAVNRQLYELNHFPGAEDKESVYQGLILISDSLPKDDNNYPDFTSDEPDAYGKYRNHGLRFAYIYSYDDEYMPLFRIVDHKGCLAENVENTCCYHSLSSLLVETEEEAIKYIDQLTEEMLQRYYC